MTNLILILSRCQKKVQLKNNFIANYQFHFKGFYMGSKIEKILIYPTKEVDLVPGEDYLLWVKFNSVCNGNLEAELIDFRKVI